MKAILTKHLPATNTLGSRIKAWTVGGHQITISYPYEFEGENTHRKAAEALCAKMNWTDVELIGGELPNGYVFVMRCTRPINGE